MGDGERHLLIWRGLGGFRTEAAEVRLLPDRLRGRGTQIGVEGTGYRLDYELETGEAFVTQRLRVEATGEGWARFLDLRRAPDGAWSCSAEQKGDLDGPPPGGDVGPFAEALDCDLGLCPLTNTMPVLREGLLHTAENRDFVMAWVSVPDLSVRRSNQRYEHIERTASGARIRYVSRDGTFTSELDFDEHGFVVRYPELGERVFPA